MGDFERKKGVDDSEKWRGTRGLLYMPLSRKRMPSSHEARKKLYEKK